MDLSEFEKDLPVSEFTKLACSKLPHEGQLDGAERHKFQSRTGNYKQYLDEILPIAKWLSHVCLGSSGRIQWCRGNQPFDAKLESEHISGYIEVTQVVDGYDRNIRNKISRRDGAVPLAGEIYTDELGNPHVDVDAVTIDEISDKISSLSEHVLTKKTSKNKYDDNTALIVCTDHVLMSTTTNYNDDFAHLVEGIRAELKKQTAQRNKFQYGIWLLEINSGRVALLSESTDITRKMAAGN